MFILAQIRLLERGGPPGGGHRPPPPQWPHPDEAGGQPHLLRQQAGPGPVEPGHGQAGGGVEGGGQEEGGGEEEGGDQEEGGGRRRGR